MRFTFFLLVSVFSSLFGEEPPFPNYFFDYPNEYYVETGASGGGSILRALEVRNRRPEYFRFIYSIDIDPHSIFICKKNMGFYSNVNLLLGDSSTELWQIIKEISKPITFFLDAHRFPPIDDGKKNCPLFEELEQIESHPLKTHTILIDDVPCCGTHAFDFITLEDLKERLLQINPDYQIKVIYNQILVATPPNKRN